MWASVVRCNSLTVRGRTSSRLNFLDDYANELYKVLTVPGLGDCVSALNPESS